MRDLRELFDELAQRGTARGADAVYVGARDRASALAAASRSRSHLRLSRPLLIAAAIAVVALVGAGIVRSVVTERDEQADRRVTTGASKEPGAAAPRKGGQITYGLESANTGGWCLPRAQLSRGGLEIGSALYDTLTVPTRGGGGVIRYAPYLAESITHDADFTHWFIKLRPGVSFHDGAPLTAAAVKQNLDAYRQGPVFGPVLRDVADVVVVDSSTVEIVTTVPWVAFDSVLWSTGRLGIVAPAQLADPQACASTPIGTGPFRFVAAKSEGEVVVERNPSYWRRDVRGHRLPYLDRIVFRPVPNEADRVRGVEDGSLDIAHTADGQQIDRLRDAARAGDLDLVESKLGAGVAFTMLNVSRPPFDNKIARRALAAALDIDTIIQTTQGDAVDRARQPFGADSIGYVDPKQLDYPAPDPDRARRLVQRYEKETGRRLRFTLMTGTGTHTADIARLEAAQATAAGMDVRIAPVGESDIVNAAIANEFDAALWRDYPGTDPDSQSIWWRSTTTGGSPNALNFGHIADPELDRLLRAGKSETDPPQRAEIYRRVSRRFATEVYNVWGWYTRWAFSSNTDVRGVNPPVLPSGEQPVIVAGVQPVVGLWIAR